MTTAQFGKRVGVSQPRVVEIEKNEVSGSLTLESLQRAANALDCRFVYALVPKQPLEALVEERALALATQRLEKTAHSMALEAQSVAEDDENEQLKQLAKQLADKSASALWNDQ